MTRGDAWLERLAELIKDDRELHDATVKLILATADAAIAQAELRRSRIK